MHRNVKRAILPALAGAAGATLLASLYIGIVSLAESPSHALELFWEDRLYVVPLVFGFGTQVGLFTFLKKGLFVPVHSAANGTTTAASGGVSTVAMVACCAHHVTDVLPLVGLTAAATFLAAWKIPFMVVGLVTNLLGIGILLWQIGKTRRHAATCQAKAEAAAYS